MVNAVSNAVVQARCGLLLRATPCHTVPEPCHTVPYCLAHATPCHMLHRAIPCLAHATPCHTVSGFAVRLLTLWLPGTCTRVRCCGHRRRQRWPTVRGLSVGLATHGRRHRTPRHGVGVAAGPRAQTSPPYSASWPSTPTTTRRC